MMNFLIIILNRVYLLLTKVKNQSPLFGAACLVTILISFSLLNIIGLYYVFKITPVMIGTPLFIGLNVLIFIPTFYYAKKHETKITNKEIPSAGIKNAIVIFLYLFTVISTVYLADINRNKISIKNKKEKIKAPRKESLEGRIRKWFDSQ